MKETNKKIDASRFEDEVRVFAPATVANMICGFDVLGFAVHEPGDEIVMRRSETPGVRLLNITGDEGRLPKDPNKNTVSACAEMLLKDLGLADKVGLEIELHKHMPIGSGLGSSAASTVGGLYATNEILGKPLTKSELLPYCIEGERLACGHPHADNVGPALFGGITLIRGEAVKPDLIQLPTPEKLHASIIFPQVDVPTRDARQLIKEKVKLKDAVVQWGNIAGLVAGLFREDYALITRSMKDVLIEPTRAILIPQFEEMKKIALSEGAMSFGISGSGPSVVAMSTKMETAKKISLAIQKHLKEQDIDFFAYVSKVNTEGPKRL